MPKAKYGVYEARFYVDPDDGPSVYIKYRIHQTKEVKTATFPAHVLHENFNLEVNDFIVSIVDRYENTGGE
jgi:hypothetical protein